MAGESSATVARLSERELIARIQAQLPPPPDWLLVGIGDDAAVVEPERNRVEVLSVDAIVEGIHFDRAFVPPGAIGHRALAVNLSDLAAMGAAPRLALLSLALPSTLPLADFDAMLAGLTRLAAVHRVHVIGGNLTRSPGPLMIDVTVMGIVKRRQALTRSGARPGDDIYVSGSIGEAAVGLRMLKKSATEVTDMDAGSVGHQTDAPCPPLTAASSVLELCTRRYLYPDPRVRLGVLLGRNRAASAAIDLSDGLADAIHRLSASSGVGAVIDAETLPIDPGVREWLTANGFDPVSEGMAGGDDYELLFTVRPRSRRRLEAARRHGGAAITRIGTCTATGSVVLRERNADRELPDAGYDHFSGTARPSAFSSDPQGPGQHPGRVRGGHQRSLPAAPGSVG